MDVKCPKCYRLHFSNLKCDCSPQMEFHPEYSENKKEEMKKVGNICDKSNEFLEPMNKGIQNIIQNSPNDQREYVSFKHTSSKDIQTKRGSVEGLTEEFPSDLAEFIVENDEHSVGVSSLSTIHCEVQKSGDLDTFEAEDQRGIQSHSEDVSNADSCSGYYFEGESHPFASNNASDSIAGPSGGPCEVSRSQTYKCSFCCREFDHKQDLHSHIHTFHYKRICEYFLDSNKENSGSGHSLEGESHPSSSTNASDSVAGPSGGPSEVSRLQNQKCYFCDGEFVHKKDLLFHINIFHFNVICQHFLNRNLKIPRSGHSIVGGSHPSSPNASDSVTGPSDESGGHSRLEECSICNRVFTSNKDHLLYLKMVCSYIPTIK